MTSNTQQVVENDDWADFEGETTAPGTTATTMTGATMTAPMASSMMGAPMMQQSKPADKYSALDDVFNELS